jgi:hypothetical protein
MSPEDLLDKWLHGVPRDGADCEDALAVMRCLGMEVARTRRGHWTAHHAALVGSAEFPYGFLTVNCHAFGKQGRAHPAAIRDIVRAARIIRESET